MSEHSIIEHRAKYHYAKVEEDYIAICSHGECSPHCKALILSILEGWLNKKFADGEKNLYTYMTIPQWIDHTYRLYERNILIDCLAELVKENLIKRNQITRYNQSTYEYILNTEVVQALIRALPEKESVYPRLDAYLAFREKGIEKRRERKKAKEEQLINNLPPESADAVEKSTTPPLINNLPPLINQLNVSSYVSPPNVTSSVCNSNQPLEQSTDTPTLSDDVAPDYENGQASMQLSTQANKVVDNSHSENRSQSYSHGHNTSPATHVGVMPVFEVPMPPGAKIPDAPRVQQPPKGVRQQPTPVAPTEIYTQEARAIRKLYDNVHGIATGHPDWEWKKMEDMAASGIVPTREDMQLVYTYVCDVLKKDPTIVLVWENWKRLPSLKKPKPTPEQGTVQRSVSGLPRLHTPDGWNVQKVGGA